MAISINDMDNPIGAEVFKIMVKTFYDILTAINSNIGDIIDLSTGEPVINLKIINSIIVEAHKIIDDRSFGQNVSSYMNREGDPEFLELVVNEFSSHLDRKVSMDEILVVPGCQVALNLVRNICESEDRPIFWPALFEFPGAVFDTEWTIPARTLIKSQLSNKRIIALDLNLSNILLPHRCTAILSNPHNPTGTLWPHETLKKLATACQRVDGHLVLDETYALPWAPLVDHSCRIIDHPNILHLYSFSKVGLAGERLGLVLGDPELISKLRISLQRLIIQTPKMVQKLGAHLIGLYSVKRQPLCPVATTTLAAF